MMATVRLSGFPEGSDLGHRQWEAGETPPAAEWNADRADSLYTVARANVSGLLTDPTCTASGLDVTVPIGTAWYARIGWQVIDEPETVAVSDDSDNYLFCCSDGRIRVTTDGNVPSGFSAESACLLCKVIAAGGSTTVLNGERWFARRRVADREVVDGPLTIDHAGDVVSASRLDVESPAVPGTPSAGKARLFAKDVAGLAELHVADADGNVVQLTSSGAVLADNYLRRDGSNTMTADLPLGGHGASNVQHVEIVDSSFSPTGFTGKVYLITRDDTGAQELYALAPAGVGEHLIQLTDLGYVTIRCRSTGTAGAPSGGVGVVGDLRRDTSGRLWICTAPGVPGTWQLVGNGATLWLPLAGGTMSGAIAMGGSKVTGLGAATAATDAPNAGQVVQRLCAVGSGSQGANMTRYYGFGGIRAETTEANAELKLYDVAGVLKNLRIFVTTNSLTTTAVFTVRKNGSDTAITISVPAGATGERANTAGTVSFAAGDRICITLVTQPDGINSIAWTAHQLDIALA